MAAVLILESLLVIFKHTYLNIVLYVPYGVSDFLYFFEHSKSIYIDVPGYFIISSF